MKRATYIAPRRLDADQIIQVVAYYLVSLVVLMGAVAAFLSAFQHPWGVIAVILFLFAIGIAWFTTHLMRCWLRGEP